MEKYNQDTKQFEPFDEKTDKQVLTLGDRLNRSVREGVYDLVSGKRIDILDDAILNYFTKLLEDEARASSIVQKLTIELNKTELKELSRRLEKAKNKTAILTKYDEVTSEIVSKLEAFVKLIKAKNLDSVEHLQENQIEVYQELREAFAKAKILKNRLRFYFKALYGVELSAKIILAQLRIIDPEMFYDVNLKNKKKSTATYSISN